MEGRSPSELWERVIEEWPAALAVLVLAAGHIYLTFVAQSEATPFGIPLLAAIAVFLLAEFGRRLAA